MILQALYEYLQRKDSSAVPPLGWECRGFKYHAVISLDGKFLNFQQLAEKDEEGKDKPKLFFVPSLGEKKGNGIKANLLWENPEYLFGIPVPTKAKPTPDPERVTAQHWAYTQRIKSLALRTDHPAIKAMLVFMETLSQDRIRQDPLWGIIQRESPFLLLSVEGFPFLVDVPEIQEAVISETSETQEAHGICLITGNHQPIARLEPPIKGVWGSDAKAERSLVSFNKDSFNSFGKKQNRNAAISGKAVLSYSAALNFLMRADSENRIQVGDATTVFWSEKDTKFETNYRTFFAMPAKDDPDRSIRELRAAIESVRTGIPPDESLTRFYVLGLSPNSARIAVRFWHQGTIGEFAENIRTHFDDLEIVAPVFDKGNMALSYLLASTALDWKSENVPPNLAGDVMRAVMSGGPYPATLLQQCLRRIRAEQGDVNRARASILKACLNRRLRLVTMNTEKEITVALDPENSNQGYRLGRLFAALEKIQEDANPGINTTIRDRFYGAASSTPVSVFPQLLKLKNHHLSKLENVGFRISHERRLAEIIGGLGTSMPAHLSMDDQARFALGYYHQRQALFASNKDNNT